MTRLTWGSIPPAYETGLDRGVFYDEYGTGSAWSGLVSVTESDSEASSSHGYFDGRKFRHRHRADPFSGSIEAFTVPDMLLSYDGIADRVFSSQGRKPFGMSYRTLTEKAYKLHIVYNALLSPSPREHSMSEIGLYKWDFTTRPLKFPGGKFASHFVVDAGLAYPAAISELEETLYGDVYNNPLLPSPDGLISIFEAHALLKVIDHGDGSFTVIGPDDAVIMLDPTTFRITWPSVILLDDVSYQISSL